MSTGGSEVQVAASASKVTVAQAFRDVVIASMNKGQLPGLAVAAVAWIILWRMPSKDLGKLAFEIFNQLVKGYLLGWGLWLITIFLWWFHAKYTRALYKEELSRIGQRKSAAQNKAAGRKFNGSRSKRGN